MRSNNRIAVALIMVLVVLAVAQSVQMMELERLQDNVGNLRATTNQLLVRQTEFDRVNQENYQIINEYWDSYKIIYDEVFKDAENPPPLEKSIKAGRGDTTQTKNIGSGGQTKSGT